MQPHAARGEAGGQLVAAEVGDGDGDAQGGVGDRGGADVEGCRAGQHLAGLDDLGIEAFLGGGAGDAEHVAVGLEDLQQLDVAADLVMRGEGGAGRGVGRLGADGGRVAFRRLGHVAGLAGPVGVGALGSVDAVVPLPVRGLLGELDERIGAFDHYRVAFKAKFAQRAKNVKLAIFLYRANIIGCLDPCQCIDQRCAFYTKVTTYSGFGHASFQRF